MLITLPMRSTCLQRCKGSRQLVGRPILTPVAALSLVLCGLALVLWVRSHWMTDDLRRHLVHGGGENVRSSIVGAQTSEGTLVVYRYRFERTITATPNADVAGRGARALLRRRQLIAGQALAQQQAFADGRWHLNAPAGKSSVLSTVGFIVVSQSSGGGGWSTHRRAVRCPLWIVVLVTAWLPLHWLVLFRSYHRHREEQAVCGQCGYDLRATPNRCPECGTVPNTGPATKRVVSTCSSVVPTELVPCWRGRVRA